MITVETVKKAAALIKTRERISAADWNAVVNDPDAGGSQWVSGFRAGIAEPVDEELRHAIEQFRKRRLDMIDVHLLELGVDIDDV